MMCLLFPTGLYTITFSKTGFKNFVRKGVTLEIQTIAVDGALQVGSISEQVVVTGETPLVETETSDQRWILIPKQFAPRRSLAPTGAPK